MKRKFYLVIFTANIFPLIAGALPDTMDSGWDNSPSWPLRNLEASGGDGHVHGQLQSSVMGSVTGAKVGRCRARGGQSAELKVRKASQRRQHAAET